MKYIWKTHTLWLFCKFSFRVLYRKLKLWWVLLSWSNLIRNFLVIVGLTRGNYEYFFRSKLNRKISRFRRICCYRSDAWIFSKSYVPEDVLAVRDSISRLSLFSLRQWFWVLRNSREINFVFPNVFRRNYKSEGCVPDLMCFLFRE